MTAPSVDAMEQKYLASEDEAMRSAMNRVGSLDDES
jgi:hypothetical protein